MLGVLDGALLGVLDGALLGVLLGALLGALLDEPEPEPLDEPEPLPIVGAIVPPEIVALVAEATEEMSRAEMAVTLLYAVGSDEITLLTLLTNALVSLTP